MRWTHGHKFGHGAVDQVAVAFAVRAHVIRAGQTVAAPSADKGRGLHRHAFADGPARHILADIDDRARPLVAEDHRTLDRPALVLVPEVDVAAAHADCAHLHQHLLRADCGFSDFLHRHVAGLSPVLHDCTHKAPS
jgi:hypothetical protein